MKIGSYDSQSYQTLKLFCTLLLKHKNSKLRDSLSEHIQQSGYDKYLRKLVT